MSEAGSRSSRGDPSTKTKDPSKAIFAIREVFQKDIVYQTRGMACAVRYVDGSTRLVTWRGVIGESDCNKSVIMDRFSDKFFSGIKRYRHEKPTIKENGRFSFLSVDCSSEANVTVLGLEVRNDISLKTSDLTAFSFSGGQDLQLKFKYEESKKKHELVTVLTVDEEKPKSFILEKSNVLGSPIMVDGRKVVVGVIGEIDGELSPVFITEAELGEYYPGSNIFFIIR